jgi:hypothetical protein
MLTTPKSRLAYFVAGEEYKRKSDVEAQATRIRLSVPIGQQITNPKDHAWLHDLFRNHEDYKNKWRDESYTRIKTGRNRYGTICFYLETPDTSEGKEPFIDDISIPSCIRCLEKQVTYDQ